MNEMLKQAFAESRIINFLKDWNKDLLFCLHSSRTYKCYKALKLFFRNVILDKCDGSIIIKFFKAIFARMGLKEIGYFIALTVLFNTFAMRIFDKEIDIFSLLARVFFLFLGLSLIFINVKR